MTQKQIHRAVAAATGEDITVIRQIGFNLVRHDAPGDPRACLCATCLFNQAADAGWPAVEHAEGVDAE